MIDSTKYTTGAKIYALQKFADVGPRAFRALFALFGNIDSIFNAEKDELLAIDGLDHASVDKIYTVNNALNEAATFIDALNIREIGITTVLDKEYPELLHEMNDPPPIIFYRGNLPGHEEKRVAIVGSVMATTEGISATVELAGKFAQNNISVVSGLARGVDAAAHLGALKEGGKSYALLGTGFDNIFPEENGPLAIELVKNGGIISEYAPNTGYSDARDIERNRLIVGLAQAVIIGQMVGDSKRTLDIAKFCHQTGKLMFILTDGFKTESIDKSAVQNVLELGAIPIDLKSGYDLISKSLV